MKRLLIVSTVALVLTACGATGEPGSDEGLAEPTTTTTTLATSTTSLDLEVEDVVPDESDLIEAAIADLADRLEVDPSEIDLVDVRDVQWNDGSIGCPKEGESYTQAIVDGVQVLLDSNGRIFDYHGVTDGRIFLCPSPDKDGGYEFVPPPGFND